MEEQKTKKDIFLPISIVIAALVVGGALMYSKGKNNGGAEGTPIPTPSANAKELSLASDDQILGTSGAQLTFFEFSDYQCPYCGRFDQLSRPEIVTNYEKTNKVKMVFRDFPLPFHEYAEKASEAAWCAGDQNKFWEMHDLLFTKQSGGAADALSVANLKIYATTLGLDKTKFAQCLDGNTYQARVAQNLASGQAIGVSGTPTVVIAKKLPIKIDATYIDAELQKNNYVIALDGGVMIVGAQPFSVYQTEIDKLLK